MTMRVIHYSTQCRRHRRYAVRNITDALCKIYEAEYNHAEYLAADNPDSAECFDAKYDSDTLLDVISLLFGTYD